VAIPARPEVIRRIRTGAASRRSRAIGLGICATALTATVLVPGAATADPSPATPSSTASATASAASVQAQLNALTVKNSQVVEAYDQAQVAVTKTAAQARAASAAAARANAAYTQAQNELSATIAMQYESGAFSTTGALLSSDSGQSYLNSLNTLSAVSTHSAQVVQQAVTTKAAAAAAQTAAKQAAGRAVSARDSLNQQRTTVQAQMAKLRTTLASLTAAQRGTYYRISNPSVAATSIPNIPAPNARAATAVAFAKAQVGKPYVWGASGPNSYDCSGLTMASWRAAGVSLPHSSAQQYGYGTHIPESALQPGDLVFMYSPISHVTIYIGGGLLVSAPQTGQDVSIVPLSAFQNVYAGATRLT
jgi:peptidoglycan DL-endopeptidase CwlO